MSKKIVAVHNYTDKDVWLTGRDGNALWNIQFPFKKGKFEFGDESLNIPDNSDSSRYFSEHHAEVIIAEGKNTLYSISFWDDDWQDYQIKYCEEGNWSTGTKPMKGGDKGGDGTPVVLHISDDPDNHGKFLIAVVAETPDENRKEIAKSFGNFKSATGIKASGKYSFEQVHGFMKHESFNSVKERAADSGFGSIGLILGKEGGLGVAEENFTGVIVGFDEDGVYEIKSKAYSIGAEEGEVLFAGLYMSTEPPSKVGGFDAFAEIAIDVEDIGFAFNLFTNFWSGAGFMVMLTDGEELELSVGLGHSTTEKMF